MNFYIVVLFICLVIGLFSVYQIAKDDLVLLRKDISMDRVFNLLFLGIFAGLFFARVFHVSFNSPRFFIDPLAFLLFPYFPGLSPVAGVGGGALFFVLYSRFKKIPLGRILDFFSIGLMSSLPVGYLGYFILNGFKDIFSISMFFIYIALFVLFMKYVFPLFQKGGLRDGSITLLFLFIFSLLHVMHKTIEFFNNFEFIKHPEIYLCAVIIFISLVLFIKQEKIIRLRRR